MTFDDVLKFNPYHDRLGRFASAGTANSFTYAPGKSKAHDLAIERHKERMAGIAPTEAQAKTLKSIESRTRNLKKEQFRVVDRDGNVVMQKQGDRHSVSYTIGEARDNFPGNITIHNHPDGGTFSTADLSDIGHGATEIRAAAPEGTYTLRNLNHGTKWGEGQKSWIDMRDDIDSASQDFKTHRQLKKAVREPYEQQVKPIMDRWAKRKAEGAPQEELNKIAKEYTDTWDSLQPQVEKAARQAYVDQYHHWYKSNAGKYGFEYIFTPTTSKTRKSNTMTENIEKSSGEIVLDQKMQDDIVEIIREAQREYPRTLDGSVAKTFDEVIKFNPYHDRLGRFATANGAMSFTHRTKDPSKQHWADMAMEREKQRTAGWAPAKPKVAYPDPSTIAGVKPGEPMTREEADQMKANPNYFKMGGYTTNCQSCVVAYEARRRGFDVITKPNTPGSALDKLSRASHEAWIDPKTGKTPERPKPNEFVKTPKQCRNMLENTIQPGERYTFGHSWKGRSRSGHIICADKDSDGNLRLFDPQNGKTMTGKDIDGYLSRIKYTTTVYGMKINCSPRLLRVDNLSINPAYANDIMSSKEAWRKQYAS